MIVCSRCLKELVLKPVCFRELESFFSRWIDCVERSCVYNWKLGSYSFEAMIGRVPCESSFNVKFAKLLPAFFCKLLCMPVLARVC